jgi:hypothetical protein
MIMYDTRLFTRSRCWLRTIAHVTFRDLRERIGGPQVTCDGCGCNLRLPRVIKRDGRKVHVLACACGCEGTMERPAHQAVLDAMSEVEPRFKPEIAPCICIGQS